MGVRNKKNRKILKRKERKFVRCMNVIIMVIFMLFGALNKVDAIEISKEKISILPDKHKEDTIIDREKIDEDNNKEVTEQKYKNTSEKGQKYIYDAQIVSSKLKKGDYKNDGKKMVFLTFDDGTSTTVTPKILKVLDDYDVKATFFVMGQELQDGGESALNLLKEEYERGHAIGNHSYSHDYHVLYPNRSLNLDSFVEDYDKNDKLLKKVLGDDFSTRIIRCPGGYMSWKNMDKLDSYLKDNDIAAIDWSALSKDAEGKKKNADELVECAIDTSKDQEMVVLLMHDTYQKEESAKALPKIIEYFKNNGYEFRTLG